MRNLTKKEQVFIEFIAQGALPTDAAERAYDCKNRQVASSIATKLLKKPIVEQEVSRRRGQIEAKVDEKLADRTKRFVEIVEKYAPRNEIAKKLAENILSSDKRVSESAIDKYLRLRDEYPATKSKIVGLFEKISDLEEQEEIPAG